jgi:hypothetical protein
VREGAEGPTQHPVTAVHVRQPFKDTCSTVSDPSTPNSLPRAVRTRGSRRAETACCGSLGQRRSTIGGRWGRVCAESRSQSAESGSLPLVWHRGRAETLNGQFQLKLTPCPHRSLALAPRMSYCRPATTGAMKPYSSEHRGSPFHSRQLRAPYQSFSLYADSQVILEVRGTRINRSLAGGILFTSRFLVTIRASVSEYQ